MFYLPQFVNPCPRTLYLGTKHPKSIVHLNSERIHFSTRKQPWHLTALISFLSFPPKKKRRHYQSPIYIPFFSSYVPRRTWKIQTDLAFFHIVGYKKFQFKCPCLLPRNIFAFVEVFHPFELGALIELFTFWDVGCIFLCWGIVLGSLLDIWEESTLNRLNKCIVKSAVFEHFPRVWIGASL